MTALRITAFTALAMLAFAGNSLLCRLALKHTAIDAASFTTVRLLSAALVLGLLVAWRGRLGGGGASVDTGGSGNWLSAFALFAYAAGFSWAYITLPAATGALLLFGAVQATMVGWGIYHGERLRGLRLAGFVMALAGLVALLLPGLAAPPLGSALLMLGAGVAWGVYSLRGKAAASPLQTTAGNFLRCVPLALALMGVSLLINRSVSPDGAGLAYAVMSGAGTSGLGYAIWYSVLPALKATHAATVQLSVPVITAVGGISLLGEPLSWRLGGACVAVLVGIALVVLKSAPGDAAGR